MVKSRVYENTTILTTLQVFLINIIVFIYLFILFLIVITLGSLLVDYLIFFIIDICRKKPITYVLNLHASLFILSNPFPQRYAFLHWCKRGRLRLGSSCRSCPIWVYSACKCGMRQPWIIVLLVPYRSETGSGRTIGLLVSAVHLSVCQSVRPSVSPPGFRVRAISLERTVGF